MVEIVLSPLTAADGPAVIDLFNHYVEHTFAAFPAAPLPHAFFERLLEATRGYPTAAARTPEGRLAGFALLRPHAPWPTCAHVAEFTCFLAPDCLRQGLGTRLLTELETGARDQGIRTLLAAIAAPNETSLAFHRRQGFREVGRFRNVCIKFQTPFDVVWMQKDL